MRSVQSQLAQRRPQCAQTPCQSQKSRGRLTPRSASAYGRLLPTLSLTWDPDDYSPDDDFPWTVPPPGGGGPVPANWVPWIEWLDATQTFQLSDDPGLYVIQRNGEPTYAGKAANIQTRFWARAAALHELGLAANDLPNQTVNFCAVAVVPATYAMPISLAEHWLIRFLVVRDFTLPAHVLTNVSRTDSFLAPAGGLSIRFDPTASPPWLSNAWAQAQAGWVNPNPNLAGFDYGAGVAVFP
jgi:hypothetical protein